MNLSKVPKLRFAKFAVIGDPVEHSLSPLMHNAAFKALGIEANYEAVHVKPDDLAKFAERAKKTYDGINVTVPHKNKIINYLDGISPAAKFAGSVNTLINENGSLWGESTDGRGLELAIRNDFGLSLNGKNVFFIGCGGACRAAAVHFASIGVKTLLFVNRTISKAEELASLIQREFKGVKTSFSSLTDEIFLESAVDEADIIIQASSLGLKKADPSPLAEKCFFKKKYYYDMLYGNTEFIKLAKKHSCPSAGGLSMLVYQGSESFKTWTGIEPPIEIMKESLFRQTINSR